MSTDAISPLGQRMIEDMSARKLNPHTQRSPNLAGRGSLVRLILARVITANYAEYLWTRGLK